MNRPSPSSMPAYRTTAQAVEPDPQLTVQHWNHGCPHPGCTTWVPNHRRTCARHEES